MGSDEDKQLDNTQASENRKDDIPPFILSVRFLLAIMFFLGYALQYTQKINMSVAVVCMVNNTALLGLQNGTVQAPKDDSNSSCAVQATSGNSSATDGEFVWDKKIQGLMLTGYFYGYTITQIPGGYISMKFGGKWVYFVAMIVGSLATVLAPTFAKIHYWGLFCCRFVNGLAHGVMWPCTSSIWAYWAPKEERSRLLGFSNAGSQIGNVIALPLGGFLCIYGFAGGWPSIFYVFGIAGFVWCIGWFFLVSSKPDQHKFITEREREYIIRKVPHVNSGGNKKTPVLKMFTSKACIALFIGHVCSNWGAYLLLTNIPTYMKEVLKFDIKSNGLLSAIPYAFFCLVISLSAVVGDKIIGSKKLSIVNVRRLFNCLGYLVPAAAIVGLSFVTCQYPYIGVGLLTLGLSFIGCAYGAGFLVNYVEIAGKYAGFLFGISNTFASIPGIVAPYLVSAITKNKKAEEWRIVFWITAAIFLLGLIVLIIFGRAETEEWAKNERKEGEPEEVPLKDH